MHERMKKSSIISNLKNNRYEYCSYFGENVLFLEDDVKASNNFVSRIVDDLQTLQGDWAFYSLYTPHPASANKPYDKFACCTQAVVFRSNGNSFLILLNSCGFILFYFICFN